MKFRIALAALFIVLFSVAAAGAEAGIGETVSRHWAGVGIAGMLLAALCVAVFMAWRFFMRLQAQTAELTRAQATARIGSWVYDLSGRISWSDEMYRIFGVPPATFVLDDKSFIELLHPEDRQPMQEWIRACGAGERPGELEFRLVRPDGVTRFISGRGELVYAADGRPTHLSGTSLDITERKLAETLLRRLNRTYSLISEVSQIIARTPAPQELFAAVCRIAVESGGFRMAWIGLPDLQTKKVTVAAHAGATDGYLDKLDIALDDSERGPTATALRSGENVVVNDIAADPRMLPWRADALRLGFRASAVFPLVVAGEARATLNLYAAETGFFDDNELQLLEKMVASLVLALQFAEQEKQRQRAEEERAENENRFRDLVENSGDLICTHDLDGKLFSVNRAATKALGYPPEALLQMNLSDVIVPELRNRLPAYLQKMRRQGRAHGFLHVRTRAGEERIWEYVNTLRTEGVKAPIVRGMARDVTERRRAEAALAASEEKYRRLSREFHALLDAIPDNLTLQSPDFKVLWANSGAAAGLDKKPEELVGAYCYELWHGRKRPCEPCPVRTSFRSGEAAGEIVTAPDGKIWELRTIPIKEAGRVVSVVEVGRDITEQRQLEAQCFHAQKMESIGTLAGGVAHDFNNILSAIIGYGHVVLMKMKKDDPNRPHVESMIEAAERAAHLTKMLLVFGRKQASERRPLELNEAIRKFEKFIRRVIGEDIECKTILAAEDMVVNADINQLEQVLMNLATNARDAMQKGGSFTLRTDRINLDEDFPKLYGYGRPGPYAMITASDTGTGMDEATRLRIFEPFFTTKEVGKGTGLGLAAMYGVVKNHDGYINVYSEPGRGTTFSIYLPLVASKVQKEVRALPEEVPLRGTETVLLAEDDEALRKLFVTLLEDYGYSVIEAVDGEDALRKFMENKDRVHILLFDLIMPRMNGKEACDEIRKIRPGMKVIFASGYTPEILQQKVSLEKNAMLIYKPLDSRDLLSKLRKMLTTQVDRLKTEDHQENLCKINKDE